MAESLLNTILVFRVYQKQISFLLKGSAVFLNISAIIHPRSFVSYCHSTGSFVSPKVSLRPTARSQEDRRFLSWEEKKERFVSKKHRFRERSFAFEQTNRVTSKRGGSSFFVATPKTNPSRVHASRSGKRYFSEYFHGAFPPRGVRCFIASEPGEVREFMEILDTYWVKVFYRMSKDAVALPNIR